MSKLFLSEFRLSVMILAILNICYEYKFPAAYMISFYELYGVNSLFTFKALICSKQTSLSDAAFTKIIEESNMLYKQILENVSKIEKAKRDRKDYEPKLDLTVFSESYRNFIETYLLKNIDDLYAPNVKLRVSSNDLYKELLP